MKKAALSFLSILLLSCGGNGNKPLVSQDTMDMDSDSVIVDTMEDVPVEKEISEEPTKVKSKSPIVGTFYCSRSGDTYSFNDDNTGMFIPNGGSCATFSWRLKESTIIITYTGESAILGSSKLQYDKGSNSFVEKSISYGKLKFVKQK